MSSSSSSLSSSESSQYVWYSLSTPSALSKRFWEKFSRLFMVNNCYRLLAPRGLGDSLRGFSKGVPHTALLYRRSHGISIHGTPEKENQCHGGPPFRIILASPTEELISYASCRVWKIYGNHSSPIYNFTILNYNIIIIYHFIITGTVVFCQSNCEPLYMHNTYIIIKIIYIKLFSHFPPQGWLLLWAVTSTPMPSA